METDEEKEEEDEGMRKTGSIQGTGNINQNALCRSARAKDPTGRTPQHIPHSSEEDTLKRRQTLSPIYPTTCGSIKFKNSRRNNRQGACKNTNNQYIKTSYSSQNTSFPKRSSYMYTYTCMYVYVCEHILPTHDGKIPALNS